MPEEIVVVLSGTVNNQTIIEQFQAKWTRQLPTISFHLKPDAPLGPNRNKGAQLARGKFVTFFDGDDVVHPQRFEIIEKVLRQIPETDIVLTSFEVGNSIPTSRYDDTDIKVNVNFDIVRETFVNVYEHQGISEYWKWCCPLLTNFESEERMAGRRFNLSHGWVTTRRNLILQHPQDHRETFEEDGKFLYDAARDGRANISILEVPLGAYYFRGSGVEKPGCVWPNSTRPSSRLYASEPSIIDIPALGGDASHLQISGTNENPSPSTAVDPPTKIKETIPSEHRY